MSREQIIDVLTDSVGQFRHALTSVTFDDRARWAHVPKDAAAKLAAALVSDSAISKLSGKVYSLSRASGTIDLENGAVYLIDRALDYKPEEIVDSMYEIAETGSIEVSTIYCLEGLDIEDSIDLGKGFYLLPHDQIAEDAITDLLFSDHNAPAHGYGKPPTSAFVEIENYKIRDLDPLLDKTPIGIMPAMKTGEEAISVLHAIILASNGAPQVRQSYSVVHDLGFPCMRCSGFGGATNFPVPVAPVTNFDDKNVALYFQLLQNKSINLDIAVGKLQTSRTRLNKADKAIDLGTCAEMLLMHGEESSGEISYKLRIRAAWLLGCDKDSRVEIYKLTRDLYNLRSKAAHHGALPQPKDLKASTSENEMFVKFDNLCQNLIIYMLKNGKWPDWMNVALNVTT